MALEDTIRDIVREEIAGLRSAVSPEPELITISTFIKDYGVNRAVVESLHRGRVANGFPSVQLGPRTIRIDKTRLNKWFASGGLSLHS